jgi:hypothetical protein
MQGQERLMSSLTDFKAVYGSGMFIPKASTVSALSLIFEKVNLPTNLKLIEEFARKYEFVSEFRNAEEFLQKNVFGNQEAQRHIKNFRFTDDNDFNPFNHLTDRQKRTAYLYLAKGIRFALMYQSLFPEVFETRFYDGSMSTRIDPKKENHPEPTRTISVTMELEFSDDESEFPRLLSSGYIPVIDNNWGEHMPANGLDDLSVRQMASLLAMKSIEIVFPKTRGVHPEVILEARERLSDHLPPFWSAMLKLSVEMRGRIKECKSVKDIFSESQALVDSLVMPSLIDLQQKMIREKRDWFYRILSPIQKGLRIMVGNPPLTQQQLLTNALVLGGDVLMSAAENMRTIEALKQEAGLTFLLEAQRIFSRDDAS